MKKALIIFLSFIPVTGFCQNSKIDSLINIRHQLYEQWQEDERQRSGFFGNQTKEDLRGMIETLKSITNKDNEIIQAVEEKHRLDQAQLKSDNGRLTFHVDDANIEMSKLDDRLKSLESQLQKATSELIPLKSARNRGYTLTSLLALLLLVSVFFNVKYRMKNH